MRYAVAIPEITSSIEHNLDKVLTLMHDAFTAEVDIVLFPELVLTGFNFNDDYDVDKLSACSLSSYPIQTIMERAAKHKMWTAFGFLELVNITLFDSAILVDTNGRIVLHHRRMSPGWRANGANPIEYGCGTTLSTAATPWGKTLILICGDLFETAFPLAVDAKPDLLLVPFARNFPPTISEPQRQWDESEWPAYSGQIKQIGALTLMSNYIGSNGKGFGGGFIVDHAGEMVRAKPLFVEGLLLWDSPSGRAS